MPATLGAGHKNSKVLVKTMTMTMRAGEKNFDNKMKTATKIVTEMTTTKIQHTQIAILHYEYNRRY